MDVSMLGSGVLWIDSAVAEELAKVLSRQGWRTSYCALLPDSDKAGVISAIAGALDFPDWTGRNLDALYDSLTDLSWIDEQQVMLTIQGTAALDSAASSWGQIRTALVEAAQWWHSHDRTLVTALASNSVASTSGQGITSVTNGAGD